jgi:hypothetical protein
MAMPGEHPAGFERLDGSGSGSLRQLMSSFSMTSRT